MKLKYLPEWTAARRRVAGRYNELLRGIPGIVTPVEAEGREHVYHLYVIRHDDRDGLAAWLKENGIGSAIQYPVALPFLPAYARFGLMTWSFMTPNMRC